MDVFKKIQFLTQKFSKTKQIFENKTTTNMPGQNLELNNYSEIKPLNIAIVSDFFYPNLGGVEMHMYALSYC